MIFSFVYLAWLLPLYEKQWRTMLSVYSGNDIGPSGTDEDDFYNNSFRCGRMLESDSRVEYCIFYFLIINGSLTEWLSDVKLKKGPSSIPLWGLR